MDAITKLKEAARVYSDAHPEMIGRWVVDTLGSSVSLCWEGETEEPAVAGMLPDPLPGIERVDPMSPWILWGGREIMESANLGPITKGGSDQYETFYGSMVLMQYVMWENATENPPPRVE